MTRGAEAIIDRHARARPTHPRASVGELEDVDGRVKPGHDD
jgi:hypothetical protein